jgi:hypothetical protein
MFLFRFVQKYGPSLSASRAHCIFAQLTNSSALGKLATVLAHLKKILGNLKIVVGGFGKIQYTRDDEGTFLDTYNEYNYVI